jgi:hypothetical protein
VTNNTSINGELKILLTTLKTLTLTEETVTQH